MQVPKPHEPEGLEKPCFKVCPGLNRYPNMGNLEGQGIGNKTKVTLKKFKRLKTEKKVDKQAA